MKQITITEAQLRTIVKESANEKRKVIRQLYKVVDPFTHHKYSDENWETVHKLFKTIEDAGYSVSVNAKDGGYRNSMGGNTLWPHDDSVSYWKEYILTIDDGNCEVNGRLVASFCGTVDDPYKSYDLTCNFF